MAEMGLRAGGGSRSSATVHPPALLLATVLAIAAACVPSGDSSRRGGGTPTDPNLRVAFIADSGNGENFKRVLSLIKSEGAAFVIHQGDFDYSNDPDGFFATITGILGPNYPYFMSVGNHDAGSWSGYVTHLTRRMAANHVTPDDPDLSDQKYSASYRGLGMVFVGENGRNAEFASFLQEKLSADDHIWKICSWHMNQAAMQVGSKSDAMGWDVYETCRKNGGIIATGHEHSYERTKTLSEFQSQSVSDGCSDPKQICVGPGRTFAFVSGLGGKSVRKQARCLAATYPYGCQGEWAFIYTSSQHATSGALFIDFYVNGDPKRAHAYFKNVKNEVVDEFDITKD